jgi:hypothetical protein
LSLIYYDNMKGLVSNVTFFVIGVMLVLAFPSCKGTKSITKTNKSYTRDQIINGILNHNIDPITYFASGDIDLESTEQSISGNFDARIKKDSIVIISARKLGVEAARLRILPSEYTILYKLEGVYQQESISGLRQYTGFDVDFDDMQALLINNVMIADTSTMKVVKNELGYIVDGQDRDMKIQYILDQDLQLIKVTYTDIRRQSMTITMSDYRKLNGHMHAHQREISGNSPQGNAKMTIIIEKLEVNTYKKLNFSIPPHYEKV